MAEVTNLTINEAASLTINEAAAVSGLSRDSIIRRQRAGQFPRSRLVPRNGSGKGGSGGRWLIPLADLRAASLPIDLARLASIAPGAVGTAGLPLDIPTPEKVQSSLLALEAELAVARARAELLEAHTARLWQLIEAFSAVLGAAALSTGCPFEQKGASHEQV
jgi:hypothetical protein